MSLLAELEPICGLAFAFNLAYLGLSNYRYKKKIRQYALTRLEKMKDNIPKVPAYNDICLLASSPDFPPSSEEWSPNFLEMDWTKNYEKFTQPAKSKFIKSKFFTRDQKWAAYAAFMSVGILVLGVFEKVGYDDILWSLPHIGLPLEAFFTNFAKILIAIPLVVSILALAHPFQLIIKGNDVIRRAEIYIDSLVIKDKDDALESGKTATEKQVKAIEDAAKENQNAENENPDSANGKAFNNGES